MGATQPSQTISERVRDLDLTLFNDVPAQLEADDQRGLLSLQTACTDLYGHFAYLEIGSYRGGSLQVMVRDPACEAIASIDPRPRWTPDQRGFEFTFGNNSVQRMMEGLKQIPEADLRKLTTFESGTDQVSAQQLPAVPQLCFIDGEHSDAAVLADGLFCLEAMQGEGCVVFHDAPIIYRGIIAFLRQLETRGVEHHPYFLPSTLFVVEVGSLCLREHEIVSRMLKENYRGYLFSLQSNELYRAFFNRRLFRLARRAKARVSPNGQFR